MNKRGQLDLAFYDKFEALCLQKEVTPTQAARDIGISQPVVAMWKKRGSTPKAGTVQKVAEYFETSVDYLLDVREDYEKMMTDTVKEIGFPHRAKNKEITVGAIKNLLRQVAEIYGDKALVILRLISIMSDPGIDKVIEYASEILPEHFYDASEPYPVIRAETAPQSNESKSVPVDTSAPQNPAEGPQKPEEGG